MPRVLKEGHDLVSEAVNDVKLLKKAALEAAKNELVESLAPAMRKLLEKTMNGALLRNEDTDRIRRGIQDNWPGESHTGFEEAKEKGEKEMHDDDKDKELDLESLASFFPTMSETEDEAPVDDVKSEDAFGAGSIPTLGEADEPCEDDESKEEDEGEGEEEESKKAKQDEGYPMGETIEISESELRKVYQAAMVAEAQVTKGFGEMTPMGEIEDVVKDVDKGLADVKKGEHTWDKETPPAKQDYMVKEMIKKGIAENKYLRENLKKAVGMIRTLGDKLHEVNLFNAKVLHVNRILNTHGRLTKEQKKVVLESIDQAETISEVKRVYETIDKTFAAAGRLSESNTRKPLANAQRVRASGGADPKVLRESADRENNTGFTRLQQLAGLVK